MSVEAGRQVLTAVYGPYYMGKRADGYEIIAIFNNSGLCQETHLEDIFENQFSKVPKVLHDGGIGPFEGLEDIQKYCFSLCQKYGDEGVSLVSLDSYNKVITDAFTGEELLNELALKGNYIKNPEAGKSGFLSGIFS